MTDADHATDDVNGRSDEWSDEEKRKRYRAAFATLPRLTQKVVWAHRIDELSYPEIAERYGIGIREVEREIARAIMASIARFTSSHSAADGGAGVSRQ